MPKASNYIQIILVDTGFIMNLIHIYHLSFNSLKLNNAGGKIIQRIINRLTKIFFSARKSIIIADISYELYIYILLIEYQQTYFRFPSRR